MYTPFDLTGKGVLITGGNGGIGLGMARALLQAGANVTIRGSNAPKTEVARQQLANEIGGGSLVATASTAAVEGAARNSHYGASKGAVTSMVRALAVELARYQIRVNSILPGWIATDMTQRPFENERFAGAVKPRIPMRRWGDIDDFGGIAVYLASDASAYTTGEQFLIDGGYTKF